MTSTLRNTVIQIAAPGFLYAARVKVAVTDFFEEDSSILVGDDEETGSQSRAMPQSSPAVRSFSTDLLFWILKTQFQVMPS